jgi:hypothetical protein
MLPFSCALRTRARLARSLARIVAALTAALLLLLLTPGAATAQASDDVGATLDDLGRGADVRLGSPRDYCVGGAPVLRLAPTGSIGSTFGATFDRLVSESSGGLSARLDLGLFSGRARLDYYARVAQSELSTAYTVQFESQLGHVMLAEPRLSPVGELAASSAEAERFARCGDGFVSALDVGARLLVSAVLQFADRAELERFVARVRVEALFGLVHSTREFVEETRSFSESAYLQVVALQEGGQPALLRSLIGPASSQSCRLDDVERCLALFRQLLAYASRVPEQLTARERPQNLAVLGSNVTRYGDSDLDVLSVPDLAVDRAVAARLARLVRTRARALNDTARLELLLGLMDAGRLAQLGEWRTALAAQLSLIDRAIAHCKSSASRATCAQAEAEVEAARPPFDADALIF